MWGNPAVGWGASADAIDNAPLTPVKSALGQPAPAPVKTPTPSGPVANGWGESAPVPAPVKVPAASAPVASGWNAPAPTPANGSWGPIGGW